MADECYIIQYVQLTTPHFIGDTSRILYGDTLACLIYPMLIDLRLS